MGSIDGRLPRVAAALAALVVTGAAAPAQAGPSDDEARARKLFEQADALGNEGKWKEACQVFQTSFDVYPAGGPAFRTADCYDRINAWEKAIPLYKWVVDHRGSDKRQDRVALAEQRLAALSKLVAAQKAGPVQQSPTKGKAPPPPPPNRLPAYVAFGAGGVGLVLGAVLTGVAFAQAGSVKAACDDLHLKGTCLSKNPDLRSKASTAKAEGGAAVAGLALAVVGAGTGAVLWALGLPKASQAVRSAVGPAGVTLQF